MSNNKINISINKVQWSFLSIRIKLVIERSPVQDWEIESCVMGDFYSRNIYKLTFFPSEKKQMKISLTYAEAFAINNFFAPRSEDYNILLRMLIEPKLPPCKS